MPALEPRNACRGLGTLDGIRKHVAAHEPLEFENRNVGIQNVVFGSMRVRIDPCIPAWERCS